MQENRRRHSKHATERRHGWIGECWALIFCRRSLTHDVTVDESAFELGDRRSGRVGNRQDQMTVGASPVNRRQRAEIQTGAGVTRGRWRIWCSRVSVAMSRNGFPYFDLRCHSLAGSKFSLKTRISLKRVYGGQSNFVIRRHPFRCSLIV